MRRTLFAIAAALLLTPGIMAREKGPKVIASEKTIASSPDPKGIYLYTPAITEGLDGRFIAAIDYGGPGTGILDGPKSDLGDYRSGNQVRVMLSDSKGRTWRDSGARLPMMHEILFRAGDRLYMIGHSGRLLITCSEDNGATWSEPAVLRADGRWHQSCGAVDIHDGKVTLVYEKWIYEGHKWPGVGPVLMQARVDSDLCDPQDRSVVLLMRTAAGYRDMGVMLKGVEREDGSLAIERLQHNGKDIYFMPIPGGRLKFHVCYDPESKLYWMVHSQITGVMNERRRLALSWSPDLLNWTLAGLIAVGPADNASRHYATCMISGDNMYVVSRSGDLSSKDAHDANLTTFHVIRNFRKFAR